MSFSLDSNEYYKALMFLDGEDEGLLVGQNDLTPGNGYSE